MSDIYFPPGFQQDPVVIGPLLPPTNAAQSQTYAKTEEARAKYQQNSYWKVQYAIAYVGYNLFVAGRWCMPFAEVSVADTIKPYASWSGYTRLIYVDSSGTVRTHSLEEEKDLRFKERAFREHLTFWRSILSLQDNDLDKQVLQIAIDECINQIDNVRLRQRKRIEPR